MLIKNQLSEYMNEDGLILVGRFKVDLDLIKRNKYIKITNISTKEEMVLFKNDINNLQKLFSILLCGE